MQEQPQNTSATQWVLIAGGSGQLGREVARATWPSGWQPVALDRDSLDLDHPRAAAALIADGYHGEPWSAVINVAAYTAVDKAEEDPVGAWAVNALAPAALAAACKRMSIPLIHVSTDYVFRGDKASAWEVDDTPSPLSVYGASKLGGELAVQASGARYAIVRTSWLISAHGTNFLKTMLRLATERDIIPVVADQRGSPTSAVDLADVLVTITVRLALNPGLTDGVFHFANAGDTSWADVAREIFRQSALRGGPAAKVEPIPTVDYKTAARRPANSLLSTAAIERVYSITPRPWPEAVSDILDELIGTKK